MAKRRYPDKFNPPVEQVGDQQIRKSHCEILERAGKLPSVDLHGLRAYEAEVVIRDFILDEYQAGKPGCSLVHGIGMGVMKELVELEIRKLQKADIIETSSPSSVNPSSSILVIFKPK